MEGASDNNTWDLLRPYYVSTEPHVVIYNTLQGRRHYPHFMDEKTEIQRGPAVGLY